MRPSLLSVPSVVTGVVNSRYLAALAQVDNPTDAIRTLDRMKSGLSEREISRGTVRPAGVGHDHQKTRQYRSHGNAPQCATGIIAFNEHA